MANHDANVILNRMMFDEIIGKKSYAKFYREIREEQGMHIGYKSFLALISNNVNWMLLHAVMVSRKLNKSIEEIFIFIESTSGDAECGHPWT